MAELTVTFVVGILIVIVIAPGVAKCDWNHCVVYAVVMTPVLLIVSDQPVVAPVVVPGAVSGPATWDADVILIVGFD